MTAPAGTGTVKDRSLLQSVQLRRVKALVVPLHKELLDLLHRGQAGHGAHTGHSDGGGVAGKSQGLALGQTGGEAEYLGSGGQNLFLITRTLATEQTF